MHTDSMPRFKSTRSKKIFRKKPYKFSQTQSGVTLVELIIFIVIISISLGVFAKIFTQAVASSVDPIIQIKALEKAQAQLDEILARKFDENTPTGGVPACGSSGATGCAGITADNDFDDVGDFNGFTDNSDAMYPVSVAVVSDSNLTGVSSTHARLITVTVGMPNGDSLSVSSYKVNF